MARILSHPSVLSLCSVVSGAHTLVLAMYGQRTFEPFLTPVHDLPSVTASTTASAPDRDVRFHSSVRTLLLLTFFALGAELVGAAPDLGLVRRRPSSGGPNTTPSFSMRFLIGGGYLIPFAVIRLSKKERCKSELPAGRPPERPCIVVLEDILVLFSKPE